MHGMPLVSVCMPTYNHELYVERAILSVVTQDYPCIQLIISDDCSTDRTLSIVRSYAQQYPHLIEVQEHAVNMGIERNVASIYPLIKGQYVCWFSGDDLYMSNKISKQVQLMQENADCIFSFHAVDVIDDKGKFLYDFNDPRIGAKLHTDNIVENLLIHRCYICANSAMINRHLAQGLAHNNVAGICSDWLLLLELSIKGKVLYLPDSFIAYRRHANNISKTINIAGEEAVYKYILQNYTKYKYAAYKGLAHLYAVYFFKYLLVGKIHMSFYSAKCLLGVLLKYPPSIFSAMRKIVAESVKRVHLIAVSGKLAR